MSKRGTENQITKDDYAREDDDENVQLGTFKKASQDELARRPMKSLRRTKSSASSGEDSSRKPSPFQAMGAFSTTTFPPPSTAPTSAPSPFAAMGAFTASSFQPPSTAPTSTPSPFAAMGTFSTPAFQPSSTEPASKPNPFASVTFGAQTPSPFSAPTPSQQPFTSEAALKTASASAAATQESDTPASFSAPVPVSTTAAPVAASGNVNSFANFASSAPPPAAKTASAFTSPFASTFAPASATATGNANPFASSFASNAAPAATTSPASLFASPFASVTKPASTTATNNAISFGNITSPAPTNASAKANPFASSISPAPATTSGNANPFASTPTSAFSKGSFTFNVGSNASTISVPSAGNGAFSGEGSQDKVDHEGYERLIRGVNQSFFKKIQKELEHNPTVNLSLIFNQYIDHRHKVRKACLGIDEPNKSRGVTGSHQSEAGPGIRMTSIAGIPVESASAPKLSFGLPRSETGEKAPAKSAFPGFGLPAAPATPTASTSAAAPGTPSASLGGTSPFSFGSSSIKGAVDPPKNPTSTAWSFATPGSQTSSSPFPSFPSFASAPTASSTTATPVTTTTTTTASISAPSTSTLFPAITSSSTPGDAPKPFLFSPKPFEFNPPKPAEAASAPKPFAFQIPSGASSPYSDAGSSTANQADNEKMPDDTKAQLVETREGEEDEETLFEVKAKLYAWTGTEYADLGVGPFRVNEHNETKKRRMIMRTGGTGILALNSWVIQGMGPKREKNSVTVFAIEGDKPKKFIVRVKEESSAEELFKVLEAAQTKS
ncbi:hypothetical protein BGZ72_007715 [Mortierella alpina]|nr:hypothetical protein BGZ72_007715 [Mortierella alpina]